MTRATRPSRRAARAPRPDPRRLATDLQAWFRRAARPLPWRASPRNPYHALVAEAMLQQTQVSRVIDFFQRFIHRFPTLHDLAAAPEADVLALWAGLGYYRRARLLHAAAKHIVLHHHGLLPADHAQLLQLPGVGPYSAGALASIVFNLHHPIVDGNVQRVLMRLHGHDAPASAPATRRWAWDHARDLVLAASDPAAFNEGLMELGATVCLPAPASPLCDTCPWASSCHAKRLGRERSIPAPRTRSPLTPLHLLVVVVQDPAGRILVERRGPRGLWAGLCQPPTLESPSPISPTARDAFIREVVGLPLTPLAPPAASAQFQRSLTHRRLHVRVVGLQADRSSFRPASRAPARRSWATPGPSLALSSVHAKAISLVAPL